MNSTIGIGIVFITMALLFYTTAVWSERIKKKLFTWMIFVFGAGFLCDLVGTSIMFSVAVHKFNFSFHSVAGYSALLIMGLHLFWAIFAKIKPKYEKYFTKFSIFAWIVWLFAFFSGIPK